MPTLLKIEEPGIAGHTLELNQSGSQLWIEIEEEWSGDTEAGFGRSCSYTIDKDDARKLAAALVSWADAQ